MSKLNNATNVMWVRSVSVGASVFMKQYMNLKKYSIIHHQNQHWQEMSELIYIHDATNLGILHDINHYYHVRKISALMNQQCLTTEFVATAPRQLNEL